MDSKYIIGDKIEGVVARQLEESGVKRVVVGVSGGADSVALLTAMHSISAEMTILAVHCNFHLRGEESDRDMHFVERLCRRLGVGLRVVHFDVAAATAERRISTEMACRELRYEKFREIKAEIGADRIAVAHNRNDNVETFLLNLMRGAGIRGLRAMKEDNGEIIRPLLGISRDEILQYLEERRRECDERDEEGEMLYVTDSTNLESEYRRNFLRNKVLPLLEEVWPEAQKSITTSIRNLQQEERILEGIEERYIDSDDTTLSLAKARECEDIEWVIRRFIARYGGNVTQSKEIARSVTALPYQSGKQWRVSGGRLLLERDTLEYLPDRREESIEIESRVYEMSDTLWSRIITSSLEMLWTELSPKEITFRRHREGDRIEPMGMQGSCLVSRIMKDNKLSQREKEDVIVAEAKATGAIIWVENLKRGKLYPANRKSSTVYMYKRKAKPDELGQDK